MILKSLSRTTPSYGQLIDYIFSDRSAIKDEKGNPFMIRHNISGNTFDDYVQAYTDNEKLRIHHRKGQVMLYHTILSWHHTNTKQLNLEVLENLGKKYFELRGINGMYLAGVHGDKEHIHMHVIQSPLEIYSSKVMRQSKAEHLDMKRKLQEYEQTTYNLSESRVNHGSGKAIISDREYQIENRTGRISRKHEVSNILADCFEHSYSKNDFYERVTNAGLTIYERGNKAYGIEDDKFNMRFKTLGFDDEKMSELDKREEREAEMTSIRTIKPQVPVNERMAQFDNVERKSSGVADENENIVSNDNEIIVDGESKDITENDISIDK